MGFQRGSGQNIKGFPLSSQAGTLEIWPESKRGENKQYTRATDNLGKEGSRIEEAESEIVGPVKGRSKSKPRAPATSRCFITSWAGARVQIPRASDPQWSFGAFRFELRK